MSKYLPIRLSLAWSAIIAVVCCLGIAYQLGLFNNEMQRARSLILNDLRGSHGGPMQLAGQEVVIGSANFIDTGVIATIAITPEQGGCVLDYRIYDDGRVRWHWDLPLYDLKTHELFDKAKAKKERFSCPDQLLQGEAVARLQIVLRELKKLKKPMWRRLFPANEDNGPGAPVVPA